MCVEKLAKFFFNQKFSFLMTMHIYRYASEKNISIHDIIKKFKDNSIDPNYVEYISFNGYKSFKRLISALEEGK